MCTKKSKKKKFKKSKKTGSKSVGEKVKIGDSADKTWKHLTDSKKLLKEKQKKREEKVIRTSRQKSGRINVELETKVVRKGRPRDVSTPIEPYERKKMGK